MSQLSFGTRPRTTEEVKPMTAKELRGWLEHCGDDDIIVINGNAPYEELPFVYWGYGGSCFYPEDGKPEYVVLYAYKKKKKDDSA